MIVQNGQVDYHFGLVIFLTTCPNSNQKGKLVSYPVQATYLSHFVMDNWPHDPKCKPTGEAGYVCRIVVRHTVGGQVSDGVADGGQLPV